MTVLPSVPDPLDLWSAIIPSHMLESLRDDSDEYVRADTTVPDALTRRLADLNV